MPIYDFEIRACINWCEKFGFLFSSDYRGTEGDLPKPVTYNKPAWETVLLRSSIRIQNNLGILSSFTPFHPA